MRPVAMTTAVRRGERQDQEKRVAESGAGPSARVHDPHVNPQLVQALPRRPVREAPIRPAGQAVAHVVQPQEPAAGLRVAHFVHHLAEIAAMGSGLAFARGLTQFYVYGGKAASRLTKVITRGSLQKVPRRCLARRRHTVASRPSSLSLPGTYARKRRGKEPCGLGNWEPPKRVWMRRSRW